MLLQKRTLLFIIILCQVIAWLAFKPVFPFSDDYCYAFHAYNFSGGNFHLTHNVFENRFGVFVPVSAFYVFGINPYTIALWPLLASILTTTVIFQFLSRIADTTTAFIASFLLAVNILQINYSTSLFPDIIVSFYSTSSIFLLFYGRMEGNKDKTIYPILLIFCLLAGFLTKEIIVLILPFIFTVFVVDFFRKENGVFWKRTWLFGIAGILALMLLYFCITGDALFRFKSLLEIDAQFLDPASKNNIVTKMIRSGNNSNIFKWLNSDVSYLFLLVFSVPSFFLIRKASWREPATYFPLFVLFLLSEYILLFHSEKYGVLFMQSRLWMMLIAPLSVTSAIMIRKGNNSFYYYLFLAFSALAIFNYVESGFHRAILIAVFLIISVIIYFLKERKTYATLLFLGPFMILSLNFIYSNSNYRSISVQSGNIMKDQLDQLNEGEDKVILSNKYFAENHIIYHQFTEYRDLIFVPFENYERISSLTNIYCVVNEEEESVPQFVQNSGWKLIVKKGAFKMFKKTGN